MGLEHLREMDVDELDYDESVVHNFSVSEAAEAYGDTYSGAVLRREFDQDDVVLAID